MSRVYRKQRQAMDQILFKCYRELNHLHYTKKGALKKGWTKPQRRRHLRTCHLLMSMVRDCAEGRYLTPMEAKIFDEDEKTMVALRDENKRLKDGLAALKKICDGKDEVDIDEH